MTRAKLPECPGDPTNGGPMRARRSTMILLAATALLAACASRDPMAADRIEPGTTLRAACDTAAPAVPLPGAPGDSMRALPNDRPRTIDDRSAELARSAPGGYAGIYRERGRLVLLLADTTELEATLRVLLPQVDALYGGRGPSRDSVQVRRVRWSFAQLHDWYLHLTNVAWRDDVHSSDIDEARNRLVYGVPDATAKERLEARLAAAGVPCGLVIAEVRAPVGMR